MADSSYVKIYKLLMNSDTFLELEVQLIRDLETISIVKTKWELSHDRETGLAYAKPTFITSVGTTIYGIDGWVSLTGAPTEGALSTVIDAHYGKDVKTYFCKEDIVRGGGTKSSGDYQDSFGEYAGTHLHSKHADKFEEAVASLKRQLHALKRSEEFQKEQHNELVIFCKNRICKAMMPWREMDDSVLRDAWDQFMCQSIIES